MAFGSRSVLFSITPVEQSPDHTGWEWETDNHSLTEIHVKGYATWLFRKFQLTREYEVTPEAV